MITLVQFLVLLFALFAWSRALLRLRDKDISVGEFGFWTIIWMGTIFLALFPEILDKLSKVLGTDYVNLILYSSIILLFYMIFRIYVKIDSHSKEITRLVREIAITNAKSKKKK
jgi:hypothetical protein